MVQNIVAHLMTDTVFDFFNTSLMQKIVVEVDSSSTKKAANVGAYLGGLFGSIDLVKLVDVDSVSMRHFENGDGDFWVTEWRVGIEERRDIDRSNQDDDDLKSDDENAAPYVPGIGQPANHCIQRRDGNAAEYQNDKRADQLVTEPASEGLMGLVVDMLPVEADIDVPWKTEDRTRQYELGEVDPGLQPVEVSEPGGEVAHAPGDTGEEKEQGNGDGKKSAPKHDPVAALEVFVGGSTLVWRNGVEVGAGSGVDVEVSGRIELSGGWYGAELYKGLMWRRLRLRECCWLGADGDRNRHEGKR